MSRSGSHRAPAGKPGSQRARALGTRLRPCAARADAAAAEGLHTTQSKQEPSMRSTNNEFEWTEATIEKLSLLWSEGHSTAEIGRRLGISKNAVVGKAHRLDLPARGSPIKRGGGQQGSAMKRMRPRWPRNTLPKLPCLQDSVASSVTAVHRTRSAPVPRAPEGPTIAGSLARPLHKPQPCCWPFGDPGTPTFRYCDNASVPGKPYSEMHCRRAYARRATVSSDLDAAAGG
jgi:GcrA cell cycle regulator